jgi:diguanylate cyclase (GGDEF)-like protein
VLQHVSATLNATVRASDTVSRHGGDEFLVVLSEVNQPSDAVLMVDKIAKALSIPFDAGGVTLHLTASIGFSLYPDHSVTPDGLIQLADEAMYLAKRARRPTVGLKPSVA